MARGSNQKLKLLYLVKIFMEQTDEDHYLTMAEIIDRLGQYEISADRKTLYTDFEELRSFGVDLIAERVGRQYGYALGSRMFELAELKLLVDSVQGAKFITERKSAELIKKLESLASRYEAGQLQRQVHITGRIKTMNESIYYNVDKIHMAISANARIRFHYFQWDRNKQMVLRRGGAWYCVSPWRLIWDDEYYYLIAYDSDDGQMKHYRVDKMRDLSVEDTRREGEESYRASSTPNYSTRHFSMYGGKRTSVTLLCHSGMAGAMIDRFGKEIMMIPMGEDHFQVNVDVSVSEVFLGWVIGLGPAVKIIGPEPVVEEMQGLIGRLKEQYDTHEK